MAVTNKEILFAECITHNIDPTKTIINTFAGWKVNGYVVKKGSKAIFTTTIWRPCKYKDKEGNELSKLRLVKASYFTSEQVEKMN